MRGIKPVAVVLLCLAFQIPATALPGVTGDEYKKAPAERRLRMHHLHTGEDIDVVYKVGDQYVPGGVAALNRFLRDHRSGERKDYDVREFDLLHDLMERVGKPDGQIDIVCGYRTPWSNNYLRQHGHGVALHSQHMEAKAIDIRIPGVKTAQVRDAALAMGRGGVGYYAASDFVHVDVGRVRQW